MRITVINTGAAFSVTSPTAATSWGGNTQQTVTWNVAGTTGGAINTPTVNIRLSTDGGFTYPISLAANVPNDGSHVVTVPNITTSTVRVRVEGAGNIFFNISTGNFDIIEADAFEPNDTTAMATVLGSKETVTLRDLTIHTPTDLDFFKYTAHDTGKLVVRALFSQADGNVDFRIRDASGDIIATATGVIDNEEMILTVVSQQMYFIEMFGAGGATNAYELEIENFPAPVPTGIHLNPADDTGMMNNDNVTSDTTPTFFIQTDVLEFVDASGNGMADGNEIDALNATEAQAGNMDGIAVEVTLVNTTLSTSTTAFANPLIAAMPEVYTITPATVLMPGVYLVTARIKVFDGRQNPPGTPSSAMGRSNASPPLWITIDTGAPNAVATIDLLPSSDTGMSNTDMVTNKTQPAFSAPVSQIPKCACSPPT